MDEIAGHSKYKRGDQLSMLLMVTVLLAVILTLVAFANYEGQFSAKQSRLTLVAAGCEYLQRNANPIPQIKNNTGGCDIDVHFIPNLIGSGGRVLYGEEDALSFSIADAVVVGSILIREPIQPWSRKQVMSVFWLLVAFVFLIVMVFVLSASIKPRSE